MNIIKHILASLFTFHDTYINEIPMLQQKNNVLRIT